MFETSRRPALVVVDMQNDFVRRGAPMEVAAARDIVPSIRRLTEAFRGAELPVIFTRYVAAPDYRHLQPRLPWLKLIEPPTCACVPGHMRRYADRDTPGDAPDVVDDLGRQAHDMVVDKIYFSAFHRTGLHDRLQEMGIDGLVVTGTLTEMCVEDTARHAVHHGYATALVADCVASNRPAAQRAALDAFCDNYGWVLTSDEIHDGLAARHAQ